VELLPVSLLNLVNELRWDGRSHALDNVLLAVTTYFANSNFSPSVHTAWLYALKGDAVKFLDSSNAFHAFCCYHLMLLLVNALYTRVKFVASKFFTIFRRENRESDGWHALGHLKLSTVKRYGILILRTVNIFLRIINSINTEVMWDNRIFIHWATVYSVYEYSSVDRSLFA